MSYTYSQLATYLQSVANLMAQHSQTPITSEQALQYRQALEAVYPLIITQLNQYIIPSQHEVDVQTS